jgi:hypothetical protein
VRGKRSPNRSNNVSDFFGKTNPYDRRNFYALSGAGLWSWTFEQGDESIRFALHQAAIETWGIPEKKQKKCCGVKDCPVSPHTSSARLAQW